MAGGHSLQKQREPGSLKEAVAELVQACGGQTGAAQVARVGRAAIARYTDDSDSNENFHMPVDVVATLERAVSDPHVTRFLAALAGHVLIDLNPIRCGQYAAVLARIGQETGQLFGAYAHGLEDGTFDPKDAARVRAEAMDVVTACMALVSDIDRKAPK